MRTRRILAPTMYLLIAVLPASLSSAATDPADKCVDSKAKVAGKKAADLMKAVGKNISKAPDTKFAANISKAQSKFTKGFTKAESKGACPTNGDAAAIEAKVDAFVQDVAGDVSGEVCDCCAASPSTWRFETVVGSGTCGQLRQLSCSNDAGSACTTDADCSFGVCVTIIGACQNNLGLSCSVDSDCVGSCAEVFSGDLPLDLDCGGLYVGGGLNTVPLPVQIPDGAEYVMTVDSCVGDTVTLGETTSIDTGSNLNCTEGKKCSTSNTPCALDSDCPATETCEDRCFFGPPLPIPNANNIAVSVCSVNAVASDAAGVTSCDTGDVTSVVPLAGSVFLTGDLLSSSTGPINLSGIQPCPLCVRQCQGGANDRFPCSADSDCAPEPCGVSTECLGGTGDGNPCTPASSALNESLPTSHDCSLDSNVDITANIGGLPINFAAVTSSYSQDSNSAGTFCGFCRDVNGEGSLCFEGNTDAACPPAIPAAAGSAFPCTSDADCQSDTDEYETCEQRTPGAFSEAAATRITVNGNEPGTCIDDLQEHDATLVYVFCIPPTFDPTVDAAGDLPGPGTASLQGAVQLQ